MNTSKEKCRFSLTAAFSKLSKGGCQMACLNASKDQSSKVTTVRTYAQLRLQQPNGVFNNESI
jgi:hypothetical protein